MQKSLRMLELFRAAARLLRFLGPATCQRKKVLGMFELSRAAARLRFLGPATCECKKFWECLCAACPLSVRAMRKKRRLAQNVGFRGRKTYPPNCGISHLKPSKECR